MSEPQYAPLFKIEPVHLGVMTGATYRLNPMRLGWYLARYKFVAKMLKGKARVAEIGCADAFASPVVRTAVGQLDLYDFDEWVSEWAINRLDIVKEQLPAIYDAIYMCDVIEHITPADEPRMMLHIRQSLSRNGVFIVGTPSLESQVYASAISKAGHVNCRNGEKLREDMLKYFDNVFIFAMNDEVVHTGDVRMAHYLFAVCVGPKELHSV